MLDFFKDRNHRMLFFRTIGIAIVASFFLLFRMTGRHGHLDETLVVIFIGIVILCLFVAIYFIEKRYKSL
jgi:hypothetical protein